MESMKPPLAVNVEPRRSALARPAPCSLIAFFPMNVESWKSPYDRYLPLRSSSVSDVPSVVSLHAIGQLLSPVGRCLSIATVHGGAGGGGGCEADIIGSQCGGTVHLGFSDEAGLIVSIVVTLSTRVRPCAQLNAPGSQRRGGYDAACAVVE